MDRRSIIKHAGIAGVLAAGKVVPVPAGPAGIVAGDLVLVAFPDGRSRKAGRAGASGGNDIGGRRRRTILQGRHVMHGPFQILEFVFPQ